MHKMKWAVQESLCHNKWVCLEDATSLFVVFAAADELECGMFLFCDKYNQIHCEITHSVQLFYFLKRKRSVYYTLQKPAQNCIALCI